MGAYEKWIKSEDSLCTKGNLVFFSLMLLRSFSQWCKPEERGFQHCLLSSWKNTAVIVLIKKPSTFWCLVIPQYAPLLCSTSIQSSSFLKVTLLGATFSHHLPVNELIGLGTKIVEIFCDSQMKQLAGTRVSYTVLSARFTPVLNGAFYQNTHCMLCEKIISCPLHSQADLLPQ